MNNKVVDWEKPIEAYHEDGRVCPARVTGGDNISCWGHSDARPGDGEWMFSCVDADSKFQGWRIRNVEPQEPPLCEHTLRRVLSIVRRHTESGVPPPDRYAELFDDCAKFICGDIETEIKALMPKDRATALVEEWAEAGIDDSLYVTVVFARWLHDKGLLREVGE